MDTILIEGLRADAIIGVHPHERERRQPLVVDIDFDIDTRPAADSDQLGDTVSYGDIARAVTQRIESSSFMLIEALAEDLAHLVLQEFPVNRLKIKVAKPEAVANADQVAIVIERHRS